ncbi:MAG: hypothetical protein AAF701_08655, partial [Pseudomonadota bacterium]
LSGAASKDADILYDYLHSQDMVHAVQQKVPLTHIWAAPWDPVFSIGAAPTIEDMHAHWQRRVRVSYDSAAGLISVRTTAFAPDHAHALATAIWEQAQRIVHDQSHLARGDATGYARDELRRTQAHLQQARQAIVAFQAQHRLLDPQADLEGRLGLLQSLHKQKAAALIDYDVLHAAQTRRDDPRVAAAKQRIAVVDGLIAAEQAKLLGSDDGAYAVLMAEYEGLRVELEFAQTAYITARASYDAAHAAAARTTKYVAAHVPPTFAERAEYPQRGLWSLLVTIALFTGWAIGVLIYYAVRDRR